MTDQLFDFTARYTMKYFSFIPSPKKVSPPQATAQVWPSGLATISIVV